MKLLTPSRYSVFIVITLLAGVLAALSFAQAPAKKSYAFQGTVEKVDRKNGTLTVDGEEVEGWMPAMTMAYHVDNTAVLDEIKRGNRIEATVYERDLTLHDVRVVASKPGKK